MINLSTITAELARMLTEAPSIDYLSVEPVRGDYVNEDPRNTPWLGVYRSSIVYAPATLGRGSDIKNWDATVKLNLVLQAAGLRGGDEVEDELESMVRDVLDVIVAEPTIGGTVDHVMGFDVMYRYSEQSDEDMANYQAAIITVTAEVQAG